MGDYLKGRGSQIKPLNRFLKAGVVAEHVEGLDEPLDVSPKTLVYTENPRKIVNRVDSPDLHFGWSMNPYQGCEHGCVYCYARNTHEYYGFSAGLDFESRIIAKPDAPRLLEQQLLQSNWHSSPIMLSGNTDCYQPLEREMKITRGMLEVLVRYRHPVGIVTKNSLILRDIDLLRELAALRLVGVFISITTLDEGLRRVMEPRTASAAKRLDTVRQLNEAGIPTGVFMAPIIPGLNHHEIPSLIEKAAEHGAPDVAYTVVRLNGQVEKIFKDWLEKNFPDRFNKVWNGIQELHGGSVGDSRFGRRMKGEGQISEAIRQLYRASKRKYMAGRHMPNFDLTKFRRHGNLMLFD